MKTSKVVSGFLLLLLVLGLFTSSAMAATITDMMGREVTIQEPVSRIVAVTASDCEILYAIGAGEMLVGRGTYCDYPAEVTEIPIVESGADLNIEQIVALAPQVVLMGTMAQSKEQTAQLEAAGIQVVVSEATNIEGVYAAITVIGEVTGKTAEATALVDSMKASFAQVAEKAAGDGTKTVYFEVSPLEWGLWTAGSGTFMDELAAMLGLKNAFADVSNWGEISQEQVLERDPDYIVTISMYYGEGPTPVEEIKAREGWQDLKALQNDTVLNADSNEISRPGPRLVDAIQTMYEFIFETEEAVPAA